MLKPYYQFMDGICRRNGWVLGEDRGDMVIAVPTGDPQPRPVVVLDFQDTTGQLALRFFSPVVPAGKIPADQALAINFQLPHGAIAIKDGQVVICATRVLGTANPTEVTGVIAAIATYAAFYAKHYGGR
jgi:hypothetical protein